MSRQQREIFHLLFLKRLLKVSNPRAFVLKGGINLRFFFSSPRYFEDMGTLWSSFVAHARAVFLSSIEGVWNRRAGSNQW